ncbi:MAG TPA: AMP-binding protein, partial [Kineobactrum sp.]
MNALFRQLTERAHNRPDDIVVQGTSGHCTAGELLADIQRLGNLLQGHGITRLALYADNSPDWIRLDLASQCHGICLVPIPTFFSASQVRHVLAVVGVDAIASDAALRVQLVLPAGSRQAPGLLPGMALDLLPAGSRGQIPPGTTKITFTSGSTGTPKGVCLDFGQCLTVAQSLAQAVAVDKPRHLCLLPLSTLLENIGGVYRPLLADGCVLVPDPVSLGLAGSSGVVPERLLQALHHWQPQTLITIPEFLTLLDTALAAGWQAPASLRFIAVGGARVAPQLVQRVRAGGLPIFEGYGLSECASVVSLNTPGKDRPGTSGAVLPHVTVSEHKGELVVEGNRFLGYLDDPASWTPGAVATGDIGHIDAQGFVVVSGRRKNLLISSFGRNISPEWVEGELLAESVILQAIVAGDGRPFCTALLMPLDSSTSDLYLQVAVDAANTRLP